MTWAESDVYECLVQSCYDLQMCTYNCIKQYNIEYNMLINATMMCIKKLLQISWTKLVTTKQVYTPANTDKQLLSHVRSSKVQYFGHVVRHCNDSIENTMITGLVESSRTCDRPKIRRFDNVMAWTGLWGSRL